jgi:hypothetical protein
LQNTGPNFSQTIIHAQFWKHCQLQNIMLNSGSTDLQKMLPQEKRPVEELTLP